MYLRALAAVHASWHSTPVHCRLHALVGLVAHDMVHIVQLCWRQLGEQAVRRDQHRGAKPRDTHVLEERLLEAGQEVVHCAAVRRAWGGSGHARVPAQALRSMKVWMVSPYCPL